MYVWKYVWKRRLAYFFYCTYESLNTGGIKFIKLIIISNILNLFYNNQLLRWLLCISNPFLGYIGNYIAKGAPLPLPQGSRRGLPPPPWIRRCSWVVENSQIISSDFKNFLIVSVFIETSQDMGMGSGGTSPSEKNYINVWMNFFNLLPFFTTKPRGGGA